MTGTPLPAMIQDAAGALDIGRLAGWLLIAVACFDVGLAFFFALVRPNPNPRVRLVLPIALGVGAFVLAGLGVAFLVGAIGG